MARPLEDRKIPSALRVRASSAERARAVADAHYPNRDEPHRVLRDGPKTARFFFSDHGPRSPLLVNLGAVIPWVTDHDPG